MSASTREKLLISPTTMMWMGLIFFQILRVFTAFTQSNQDHATASHRTQQRTFALQR